MQAWTPVKFIGPDHARTGTAGTCQGVPFTPQDAGTAGLAALAEAVDKAEHLAADARASLAELAEAVAAKEADAKAAKKKHAAAVKAVAAGEPVDNEPRVMVKWDADGAVEAVPVSVLEPLA